MDKHYPKYDYQRLRKVLTKEENKELTKCRYLWVRKTKRKTDDKPYEVLLDLFAWCESPQGHSYWSTICYRLGWK